MSALPKVPHEMKMKLYVEYWENILLHLSKPLPPQSIILLEGFWTSNNWKSNYARVLLSIVMDIVDPEDLIKFFIVGQRT
jgi:hypothetical protein